MVLALFEGRSDRVAWGDTVLEAWGRQALRASSPDLDAQVIADRTRIGGLLVVMTYGNAGRAASRNGSSPRPAPRPP